MTFEIFKQAVARVKELDISPRISLTGQGESTLHSQLVEFVRYATSQGVVVHMTTNANLLNKTLSRELLAAGLMGIAFSVSDFDDDYELVYNLSFEKTRTNILDFLEVRDEFSDRDIGVVVSIVQHDLNVNKIEHMKSYWKGAGIEFVMEFEQNNRGGACDNAHYFIGSDRFVEEAKTLMAEQNVSTLCSAPFHYVFIGWNGQYYICCSDYKKESPLGSVFEHSIDAMDQIKLNAFAGYLPACSVCNIDPVNAIREKMFEVEKGDATQEDLHEVLAELASYNHKRLPKDIDILHWQDSVTVI